MLTCADIEKSVEKAKRTYLKGKYPYRGLVKNIDPIIRTNDRYRTTFGAADAVGYHEAVKRAYYNISQKDKRYKIDGKQKFIVIEINPNIDSDVLDLIVAHEMAHLLDFLLRGFKWDSSKRRGFHDKVWKELCLRFGGNGEQYME